MSRASANVIQTGIKIELDQETLAEIIRALRTVEGRTEEFVISRAANDTAKVAQRLLAARARETYQGPWSEDVLQRSEEAGGITKATAAKPSAEIKFASKLPHITEYKWSPKNTVTRFSKSPPFHRQKFTIYNEQANHFKKRSVKEVVWRMVGRRLPRPNMVTSQLRFQNDMIADAFSASGAMTGKQMVLFRKKKGQKTPLPVRAELGTSDMVAVRNEKVYGREEGNIQRMFLDNCEKRLSAALAAAK